MLPRFPTAAGTALAIALIAASHPAIARDADAVSGKLADPATQLAVTTMLTALSEAVLDLRIDPIARAMRAAGEGDAVADLPPDARVRDIAGSTGEHLPAELGHHVPHTMGRAADVAGAMEDMLPQLKAIGAQMRNSIPRN